MNFENTLAFARSADASDQLARFRKLFFIPPFKDGQSIYLCGNSLGLQPVTAAEVVELEVERWKTLAVKGHFEGQNPWLSFHKPLEETACHFTGALPGEVVTMNTLSVNLHLMMASFFRPAGKRTKILIEANAFPSDIYGVASQLKFHGLPPEEHLIELETTTGKNYHTTSSIVKTIEEHANELALVMLSGVNYYSGQFFNIKEITTAAHKAGAIAGFDLAHAAGNLPLHLHNWEVDFAVWCNYKYLNSGPGAIAGTFVHQKHGNNPDLPRFAGWWGYPEKNRFKMPKEFVPAPGAEGWQLSNAPILAMAPVKASYEIFAQAGMLALREKSILLTGYLEFLVNELNRQRQQQMVSIITPEDPEERGCQLSLIVEGGKQVFKQVMANGVILDWREPNIMRAAPVPLYNSFEDVYHFVRILENSLPR